jgi:dTDP-4-dehydrorhamnose reductase
MPTLIFRGIVSGGQSGVDRAALDVAREMGVAIAGWCLAGRVAEDGVIPTHYGLRETPDADPAQRTAWNVFDTDATLILSPDPVGGGTGLAAEVARRFQRPLLIVDPTGEELDPTLRWLSTLSSPVLLNIAGPRESETPGAYRSARSFLSRLMKEAIGVDPVNAEPRRALITGGDGYLGGRLLRLTPPGWDVTVTTRRDGARASTHRSLELSDPDAVDRLVAELRPELVVHTAYGTDHPERDIWLATRNVVDASGRYGAHLVHLSSDMVLDGENAPFDETAPVQPVNSYGRWKGRAEQYVRDRVPAAAVVRLSLITSFEPPDPRTARIVDALRGERDLTLYIDELRTPILLDDLARQIWEIARLEGDRRSGVWHLAGPEALSRFAIGALVSVSFGLDPARIRAARIPDSPDPRPRDLRLLTRRADSELLTRASPLSVAAAEIRAHPKTDISVEPPIR